MTVLTLKDMARLMARMPKNAIRTLDIRKVDGGFTVTGVDTVPAPAAIDTARPAACRITPAPNDWRAVHQLADTPGVTVEQVRDALDRLTAGYPRRQQQLAEYIKAKPIDPANLEAWLHDLHNTANRRAGKPVLTLDAARAARQVGGPIDMVYLYVDGSDPVWQAKVRKTIGRDIAPARCTDAGELRAALTLADRYAPWIRNIYVVTDNQRPAWLADHARVRVVDHRQIIPAKYLPTFNSHAIEPWLHRIPGLAEHFLYANDDMMFGRAVTPNQFFTGDGRMIVRQAGDARTGTGDWNQACRNAADLLDTMFGQADRRKGWHHIKPLRRSMLAEIARKATDTIARTSRHRTRSAKDIAWDAGYWQAYALATGHGVEPGPADTLTAEYIGVGTEREGRAFDRFAESPRHLLCINNTSADTADRVRQWLDAIVDTPKQVMLSV